MPSKDSAESIEFMIRRVVAEQSRRSFKWLMLETVADMGKQKTNQRVTCG
jgi:hypothetical protein